jgi:hypothetical protein
VAAIYDGLRYTSTEVHVLIIKGNDSILLYGFKITWQEQHISYLKRDLVKVTDA